MYVTSLLQMLGGLLLMRVVPCLVVAIEILNALSLNSVKLRPDDVLAYLDRIHNSEVDKYRRDNVINIPTNTPIQEITVRNKAIDLLRSPF
ncbi:MAG: hypothetical protein ACI9OI_001738 [Chitinophagales bacterium]|jgi:hypothetical protein